MPWTEQDANDTDGFGESWSTDLEIFEDTDFVIGNISVWQTNQFTSVNVPTLGGEPPSGKIIDRRSDNEEHRVHAWLWLKADLPAVGVHALQFSSNGNRHGVVGGVVWRGPLDSLPAEGPFHKPVGNVGALSTQATTTEADSLIYDVIARRNGDSQGLAPGGSQTEVLNRGSGIGNRGGASYRIEETPGEYTMSWSWDSPGVAGVQGVVVLDASNPVDPTPGDPSLGDAVAVSDKTVRVEGISVDQSGGAIDTVELRVAQGGESPFADELSEVLESWEDPGEVPEDFLATNKVAGEVHGFGLRSIGPGGVAESNVVEAETLPGNYAKTDAGGTIVIAMKEDLGEWNGVVLLIGKHEEDGSERVDHFVEALSDGQVVGSETFEDVSLEPTEVDFTFTPVEDPVDPTVRVTPIYPDRD